jgi:predicted TIM-barrel fold metal-dependent hydrolase
MELVELAPRLHALRSPFVLDHLARIDGRDGVTSPAFLTLMRLLDTGRCWVKLASLYRLSAEPYPHSDMLPMIARVVAHRPDRIIWGSNWPHPICPVPMPNDGDIVDLIPLWLPDVDTQRQVLVDNPAALYGFPPID